MADAAGGSPTPHRPAESDGRAPGRDRLSGRRILIVGAGQDDHGVDDPPIGNGRAMAVLFAREGATIAAADLDPERADATVRSITAGGGHAVALPVDVSEPPLVEAMVSSAVEALGGLDGVVYNVGIADGLGLEASTAERWDRVMAINVRGAMLTARTALPAMDSGGSMVFISSLAGITAGSRIPAYDASKAALGGLVRHVALEGRRRSVRANVVAPGLMDTALGRAASRGRPSRERTRVPLGRQGTGWETAYAALFLISDESAYVTGQTLIVDGGLSAIG